MLIFIITQCTCYYECQHDCSINLERLIILSTKTIIERFWFIYIYIYILYIYKSTHISSFAFTLTVILCVCYPSMEEKTYKTTFAFFGVVANTFTILGNTKLLPDLFCVSYSPHKIHVILAVLCVICVSVYVLNYLNLICPAPPIAGADPPKKEAPRSECAIYTDR